MKISKEGIIITVVGLVFLIIIGVLIWKSSAFVSPGNVSDQGLLVRSDSHMTGTSSAKVNMVEFGDYECPACGAAYPLIKSVTDIYQTNPNFNFVFRNFPLPQHQYALISAEAAEAAGAQGKYWEMHDLLYAGQDNWSASKDPLPIFAGYAQTLGLDVDRFKQEVTDKKYQSVINADLADVSKLGLDHTPTVFINGEEQTDLNPQSLKTKIDALLAK